MTTMTTRTDNMNASKPSKPCLADLARAYNEAYDAAVRAGRPIADDPAVLAAKRALEAYEAT
jgi:hypothetical protein